ncbi:MAG: hypothetical protein R3B48_01240 [Kofleriaceae bacterium]
MSDVWLKCSACRKELGFSTIHWICSVSTCNRSRTRLVFCSVACWDSHVATARHRDAWAVEERSPSRQAWQATLAQEQVAEAPRAPAVAAPPRPAPPAPAEVRRRVVGDSGGAPTPAPAAPSAPGAPAATLTLSDQVDHDVLIVVSKMKKYIRDRSSMNCSDAVADALSVCVRALCDEAIRAAAADGRKTVLDRDVPKPRS